MSYRMEPQKNAVPVLQSSQDLCVHDLVQAQASRTPNAIAVVEGDRLVTYRDLDERSNQLAAYLRKRGGGPDVPVAICLKRSIDLVVSLLAVLKAGGACVPLDPAYPAERLQYMLQDTRAILLLTEQGLLPRQEMIGKVIDLPQAWSEISQESKESIASGVTPKNLAHIIYTSGSTGKPRGVMLQHDGLVNHHLVAQELYDLRPSDRMLQFSSISFDIALEEIFPTWIAGGTLVLRTDDVPLTARDFVRWIEKQKITVLDLPTAFWHELVHQLGDLKKPLPETLRLVIVGGEKASTKALNSWNRLVKGKIRWINTYGPSEASIIATAYEPSADRIWEADANIPVGRPIANTQVYLLDGDLNRVAEGEVGELHIGGVALARGYLNQPKRTAEKFINDPFSARSDARLYKTGDMARYQPDGQIEFLGRMDDQVKIRGFRVELGEIETVLAKHPAVQESVVVLKGSETSKQLVAYIVLQQNTELGEAEARSFLKARLPDYMIPASVVTLEKLPLTPNGKVDKKGLPEPVPMPANQGGNGQHSADPFTGQITRIWETVLGRSPIGTHENFFELGGHSLLAVRLMHSLEQSVGVRLPITALLQAPTIDSLAALLRRETVAREWSSLVALQARGSNPPFFCVHGVGGTVLRFRELARLLGSDQPFYGLQAQGLDGKQPVHTHVEDMADHYIHELQAVQTEGPYYLGGYSLGGMIALEMARQLRDQGHNVGLVVLLDTFPGSLRTNASLFSTYLMLPLQQKWQHITRKAKALPRSLRRRVAMMRLPAALTKVREACYLAGRTYQPKPYDGSVVLFRASEKGVSASNQESAWKSLVPEIEICDVQGHHGNIVDRPQVQVLAEKLKSRLGAAFGKSEPMLHSTRFMIATDSPTPLEMA